MTTERLQALSHACVRNDLEVVLLLLEGGADPDEGEAVVRAAELGHTACLDLLLHHGAEISQALHDVCACDFEGPAFDGLWWLLENGADPNLPHGESGELPLHRVAAHSGSVAAAELLLEHGSRPDAERADGATPLMLAVRSGNQALKALLLAHDADPDRLTPADRFLEACHLADEATARALATEHPDLFGAGGAIALHEAAWRGRTRTVAFLVGLGAPLDVRDGEFGVSALAWAAHGSANCRSGDEEYLAVIDLLLDAGASYEAAVDAAGLAPEALASPRVAQHLRLRRRGGDTLVP